MEGGQELVRAGQQFVEDGQEFVRAGQQFVEGGQELVRAGQHFVEGGQEFVEAGQRLVEAGQDFELAVQITSTTNHCKNYGMETKKIIFNKHCFPSTDKYRKIKYYYWVRRE